MNIHVIQISKYTLMYVCGLSAFTTDVVSVCMYACVCVYVCVCRRVIKSRLDVCASATKRNL